MSVTVSVTLKMDDLNTLLIKQVFSGHSTLITTHTLTKSNL